MFRKIMFTAAVMSAAVMFFTGCASKKSADTRTAQAVEELPAEAVSKGSSEKLPDATAPVLEMVVIYMPKSDGTGLSQAPDGVSEINAQNLFTLLVDNGVVPGDVQYVDFSQEGDNATLTLAGFDEAGQATVASITNTMNENLDLKTLTIVSDGKTVVENDEFHEDFKKLQ